MIKLAFPTRDEYKSWLIVRKGFRDEVKDERAHSLKSSPFVRLASGTSEQPISTDITKFVGGCDDTIKYLRKFCASQLVDDNNVVNSQ